MKNVDMDFWTLLFCFFINHWTHGACKRTLNQSVAVFDGRLKRKCIETSDLSLHSFVGFLCVFQK